MEESFTLTLPFERPNVPHHYITENSGYEIHIIGGEPAIGEKEKPSNKAVRSWKISSIKPSPGSDYKISEIVIITSQYKIKKTASTGPVELFFAAILGETITLKVKVAQKLIPTTYFRCML